MTTPSLVRLAVRHRPLAGQPLRPMELLAARYAGHPNPWAMARRELARLAAQDVLVAAADDVVPPAARRAGQRAS